MQKILHVLPALDGGGIERLLFNYYKFIDRNNFKFDFAIHSRNNGILGKEFLKLGSKIYYLTPKKVNLFKFIYELSKILDNGKYDIIHIHQNYLSWFSLLIAKIKGIKIRIVHSHNSVTNQSKFIGFLNLIQRKFILNLSTHLFACGEDAARWLFGDKLMAQGKIYIMNNALNIEEFHYDSKIRNKIKLENGIIDKLCIGHVGRFAYQKNHNFLIEIFYEISKINKDIVLILIGAGELLNTVKMKVKSLGIENSVIFLGIREDVNKLYNIFDILLLPSHFEGLPVVLVEAQASGLNCLVSDIIDKKSNITGNVEFLSLNRSASDWASYVLNILKKQSDRNSKDTLLIDKGFSIQDEVNKLQAFYTQTQNNIYN